MDNIFFLGIGGIGMSALARYFHLQGKCVAGYDLTPSPLIKRLEEEGMSIIFDDDPNDIPAHFRDKSNTFVVRTPAVPADSKLLLWFEKQGFEIRKRSEVLGMITNDKKALCVAGTHGKTTTSTMLAHLLQSAKIDGTNAFLGGISMNYDTNMLFSAESDLVVVEADEYDRSFHYLKPEMAVITSTDPDHLDIYGTADNYREAFSVFTSLIHPDGVLLRKKGIVLESRTQKGVREYTYSADNTDADFYADNIRTTDGNIYFDFHGKYGADKADADSLTPAGTTAYPYDIRNIQLGVPVEVNIENAVAAIAIARLNGVSSEDIKHGMATFRGTLRRFNTLLKTDHITLIDDYAHHPDELRNSITSVRKLYPEAELIGVFQPHLYSRTRDFHKQFGNALSLLDQVILLPIYPARELPIDGVTSELIYNAITTTNKYLCEKSDLTTLLSNAVKGTSKKVILTLGAGDIDRILPQIKQTLNS